MAKHDSKDATDDVSDAVEATEVDTGSTAEELGAPDSGAPKHGFFVRLYTGTGAIDVVGKRKLWFGISGA
ncbi:MAG: preprotein translocase subunit SecF, partial [Mycobacterium sp.]|nr:preprotein translocase subunit SecF [Mycobacterium sp.]